MFRVYATMDQRMPLSQVADHARRAEALGYDGLCVPDSVHDALLGASIALQATERLHVATSVLVAFPRSPMTVAHAAWDLQELSGGRFELGLGSQVRGNIVGRYSTPWAPPVARMREYVRSLRAIFACWQEGTPLRFEGEHYRFTRMQPFFKPDPLVDMAPPPIYLGGIGPAMTALAGEAAEGLMTHPTNSAPRYLREVMLPRLAKGAGRIDRDPASVELMVGPLYAAGPGDADVTRERGEVRQLLAFLFSTPAYWPSLELFGWKERGERLHALTREGRWAEMNEVIDDAMIDTLVISAPYAEMAARLREWYGGLTRWITFPMPADPAHDAEAGKLVAELRGA